MNIWIGYVSCGSGHRRAAEALGTVLDRDAPLFIFDLLDFTNPFLKGLYQQGYAFAVKHLPFFWWFVFFIHSFKPIHKCFDIFHGYILRTFISAVIKEDPDLVVSTHFSLSEAISQLREEGRIRSKLITLVTDFDLYPLWVNKHTEYYVVPSAQIALKLEQDWGVDKDTIKLWGIPLRRQFFTPPAKKPEGLFTFFLFASEFGLGPFKEVIKALYRECGMVIVCGRNKRIKRYAESLKGAASIRTFGTVDEVAQLMDSVDIVVTKAGGLTVSECIARKKPMVFMTSIPGQEEYNTKFVVDNGLGLHPCGTQELIDTIRRLKNDPGRLAEFKKNFDKLPLHDSALLTKELVLSLLR
ncbi:glycosyltransferase [Candidatus Omnitrophota bacterium]